MSPNLPSPSKEVFLSPAPIPRVENMEKVIKTMPSALDSGAWANSKYYKGGFEPKMTKREVN